MALVNINCPNCNDLLVPLTGIIKPATSFNQCLRRCDKCQLGYSNSKNSPTIIYKNHHDNIPEMLRKDLDLSLNNSINELNRKNKINKLGFSTSEDALTWSFFRYFVVKNKLNDLLQILDIKSAKAPYEIYLWGTLITPGIDSCFLDDLVEVSNSFNEIKSKRTEPDVIIKLPNKLIFIEVKYLSSNEISTDKGKFIKYDVPDIDLSKVILSEHYELFRNWAFVSKLSKGSSFELINLALEKLFNDKNTNKLNQFEDSLKSTNGIFRKLGWENIFKKIDNDEYETWFKTYMQERLSTCKK